MARAAADIQAEITSLETYLQSSDSLVGSVNSRGTGITRMSRADASKRLDQLYQQYARATGAAPMIVRGVVKGLRR